MSDSEALLRSADRSSTAEEFSPLPTYSQTRNSNETYTNVTTTRTDPDGSVAQSIQIISKR